MVPAYRSSVIDSYTIIAEEGKSTKGVFRIASFAHAKMNGSLEPLQPRTVARVTTGAPLPPNANAVVMVEDTASSTIDGQEEAIVEILADDIVPGENVREAGSDIDLKDPCSWRSISPAEIGLLAATGTRTVKIFKKSNMSQCKYPRKKGKGEWQQIMNSTIQVVDILMFNASFLLAADYSALGRLSRPRKFCLPVGLQEP